MTIPNIFNIQKYSIHDGEGIRTTIFFKGCHLSCPWCHNPESQMFIPELLYVQDKCTLCGSCIAVCPQNAILKQDDEVNTDRTLCNTCSACTEVCLNNARSVTGRQYTVDQLIRIAEQDRPFYESSHGGITLSGGEVMNQDMDYISSFVKELKKKGFHIAIDTCGYAPYANFEQILPDVDVFLYDIKLTDSERHRLYTGKDNRLILANLQRLSDHGACLHIRIPVINGINTDKEDRDAVIHFLKENIQVAKVSLLPYHNTGKYKYNQLGRNYWQDGNRKPSDACMQDYANDFKAAGFPDVRIGG